MPLSAKYPPGLLRLLVQTHRREVNKSILVASGITESVSIAVYVRINGQLQVITLLLDTTNLPDCFQQFVQSYGQHHSSMMLEAETQLQNKFQEPL